MTPPPNEFNYVEKIMETAERVSALEQRADSLSREMVSLRKQGDDITEKLDALLNEIAGWKGKFGGFLLGMTCIWTFIISMWSQIVAFIKFYFTNGNS